MYTCVRTIELMFISLECPTDVYHGVTVSLELGEKMYIPLPQRGQCFVVTCKVGTMNEILHYFNNIM